MLTQKDFQELMETEKIQKREQIIMLSFVNALVDCVKFYANERNFSKELNDLNITGTAKGCLEKMGIELE